MYTKQELSALNQEFWTALGQYLAPIPNAEGEKINWINYKTGEKNIRFVMRAEKEEASIFIELSHKDVTEQQEYLDKFAQFKKQLEVATGEAWEWLPQVEDDFGKTISIITKTIGLSFYNKKNWPALISFFKQRIIALDEFWCNYKFAFEK